MERRVKRARRPSGLDAAIERARRHRAKGRPDRALAECDAAIRRAPRFAAAHAWRGEILRALGRPREAAAALGEAVRFDPRLAWAYALRGQLKTECGDDHGAGVDFETAFTMDRECVSAALFFGGREKALSKDPLCAWMLAWRGSARAAGGDVGGALGDLDRAIALDARWAWMHARRGEARLMAGRARGALGDLDRAIALRPDDARARFWRGEARRRGGDTRGALADLNFVVYFEPDLSSEENASARAFYGMAFVSRALVKGALRDRRGFLHDLARGFGLIPERLRAQTRRTLSEGRRGELDAVLNGGRSGDDGVPDERSWRLRAERMFAAGRGRTFFGPLRAALKRAPNSAVLHILSWRAQDDRGHGAPRNLRLLERSIELGMDIPAAYSWLGGARLDLGRYRAGVEAIARAVALDPRHAWEHASWPRNLSGQASAKRSAVWLKDISRLQGTAGTAPVLRYIRARLFQNLGRYDRSEEELRKAERLFAACPGFIHCSLGEMLLKQGKMREAFARLDRAVALDPGRARSLAWRGEARYWLGRAEEAAGDFRAAVAADPEAHWMRAWHGEFLLWIGRYAEAERELDRAITLAPEHGWAYGWRGAAKACLGRLDDALADLDRAVRKDSGDMEALIWRGEALSRLGRHRRALRDLDAAVAGDPGRFWSYAVRGWVRGTAGDRDGMLNDYAQSGLLAPERLRHWKPENPRPAASKAMEDLRRARARAKGNRTYRKVIQ
ncbi:MAG: tetratricopeptide repeat protein [Elusimicrobiota bacterium]